VTPEQAQQARQQALNNAILGLGLLGSDELAPDHPRASAVLLDLQGRIRRIEAAQAAAEHAKRPAAGDDEGRIAELMREMAARGLNRV
jgi:hypothetical protein